MNAIFLSLYTCLYLVLRCVADSQWIDYPDSGFASMTHYTLPLDFIASCGCVAASTHYPTAALSQMAYGSSAAFGPGCGRCFNLTLINPYNVDPPFYPNTTTSVVVRIIDLCPKTGLWCSASKDSVNPAGHQLNFDLAWPSSSIPDDFFPSDPSVYGYDDFGVWNISYASVPCEDAWSGASNQSDFGAVDYLGNSVCCPTDPFTNTSSTCASYSDLYGIPADATPGVSSSAMGFLYPLFKSLVTLLPCFLLIFLFQRLEGLR